MKGLLKWSINTTICILILLAILSIYSMVQSRNNSGQVTSILGYKPMSVLSGSMSPLLEAGDMIVVKQVNAEEIKINDVITYRISYDTLVTHRVVDIVSQDRKLYFKTKGDANNVEDSQLISQEQLMGRLSFNIPNGGHITSFIKSPQGFILIILFPIILLIGGEVKNLKSGITKDSKVVK